jgi:hypothetical protein
MMRLAFQSTLPRPLPVAAMQRGELVENEPFFSPALRRAIDSETRMRASRSFDAQFFARLEEKRAYSRTLRGRAERFFELELSGVAVWRLLGSGVAGGVLPALVLAYSLAGPAPRQVPVVPQPIMAFTAFNQRKFWEEEAWKSPFRSSQIALLDPHFNLGGASCDSLQLA